MENVDTEDGSRVREMDEKNGTEEGGREEEGEETQSSWLSVRQVEWR